MRAGALGIRGLALAGALMLGASACTDDGPDTFAAGQPIRDGFTVAEGSALVAPALPTGVEMSVNNEPVVDDGFIAVLEVRGDPVEVLQRYLDQAAELGMTERSPGDESPDFAGRPEGYGCRAPSNDQVYTCAGFARTPDGERRRSLTLQLWRGTFRDAPPMSHLELRVSTVDVYWSFGADGVQYDTGLAEPPAVPDDLDLGDDAAAFAHHPVINPVARVPGSRVVADLTTGPSTGLVLVEVTGDPAEVLVGYAAAFEEIAGEARRDPTRPVPGGRQTAIHASSAGGVEYQAWLYEPDGGDRSWLLIRGGYD
jgi:hypothetical protein